MYGQRTADVGRARGISETAPNVAPPPGNPRFPLFDSLRAIAALSVFAGHTVTGTLTLSHSPGLFVLAVVVADEGVAIFFLISGFLLYRPFLVARRAGRPIGVRDFASRRILRIVPAYWVALSLFLLAGVVSGVTAHNWWIFYGFGQIYSINNVSRGLGVAWTLCVEVTFYTALPIFAWLAAALGRRRRSYLADLALLLVLAVASLLWRVHFDTSFANFWLLRMLPATFAWFAFGMGLAVASVATEERPLIPPLIRGITRAPTLCWLLALGGTAAIYELLRHDQTRSGLVVVHVLYGLIALCILLPGAFGDTAGGLARSILRRRWLVWTGVISYALYLYHPVVIQEVAKRTHGQALPLRYLIVLGLSLPISLACAAASYYLLERPIMRLGKRREPVLARAPGTL